MTTERSATYVSTIIVNSAQQVPGHRESFKFNEFNTGAHAREMRLCPFGFTHSGLSCSAEGSVCRAEGARGLKRTVRAGQEHREKSNKPE